MSNNELFRIIADRMNPEEIVDVLGLSSEELVDVLRFEILSNKDKFDDIMDEYL